MLRRNFLMLGSFLAGLASYRIYQNIVFESITTLFASTLLILLNSNFVKCSNGICSPLYRESSRPIRSSWILNGLASIIRILSLLIKSSKSQPNDLQSFFISSMFCDMVMYTPGSSKSLAPKYRNSNPNVVFPLPGGPDITTERFCFNPPDMIESNPGMPVLTLEYVKSISKESNWNFLYKEGD